MSEEEWLNSSHTGLLLRTVREFVSDRKYRLFVCACTRPVLPTSAHPDLHRGVEIAEQMADGIASHADIEWAREIFCSLHFAANYLARGFVGEDMFLASFVREAVRPKAYQTRVVALLSDYEADKGIQNGCGLSQLRDIFGNPFQPVDFAPWRTDTAIQLARQMYEAREFSAMPILADALQDAGCDNEEVLNHCRDTEQVHVRGCWVVDGVLGLS